MLCTRFRKGSAMFVTNTNPNSTGQTSISPAVPKFSLREILDLSLVSDEGACDLIDIFCKW